jgi:hypothetical protein
MRLWNLFYCGPDIVNESPEEYLYGLNANAPQEGAIIERRLETLCDLLSPNWPPTWIKLIKKNLYQLKAGDHRIYFGIYKKELIVFFICRKVGNSARKQDIKRALLNQEDYEKKVEGFK